MTTHPADEACSLLNVNQAAQRARRSSETIRRWVWSGQLPARREGGRLLIVRADLDAVALERGSRTAPSLAEWAAAAREALQTAEGGSRASAADLVLADRRDRSGELLRR